MRSSGGVAVRKLAILMGALCTVSASAQQISAARDLNSRIECPQVTPRQLPPSGELRVPSHIDMLVPDPFIVQVRCEVAEGGRLLGCIAQSEQENRLRDLGFVERFVMHILVEDSPRPCGQTTVTLATTLEEISSEGAQPE